MKILSTFKVIFALSVILLSTRLFAQKSQELINYSKSDGNSSFDSIPEVIIDSDCNLDEALSGQSIPEVIKDKLKLVNVSYYGFNDKIHQGKNNPVRVRPGLQTRRCDTGVFPGFPSEWYHRF